MADAAGHSSQDPKPNIRLVFHVKQKKPKFLFLEVVNRPEKRHTINISN